MANLSELNQWDAGVYRLELTDPAEGGEAGKANAPLKNLANRTVYLKARVDGLEAGTLIPAASETVAGKVELATAAEVQTGTDTARAVTPAGLAARTATETRAGVVELATTAEATTGTDTARAVTPAGVAAAIAAGAGLGVGQTWQDVGASRVVNTVYQNTTGKPIQVMLYSAGVGGDGAIQSHAISFGATSDVPFSIGSSGHSEMSDTLQLVVPNGWYYKATDIGAVWYELR